MAEDTLGTLVKFNIDLIDAYQFGLISAGRLAHRQLLITQRRPSDGHTQRRGGAETAHGSIPSHYTS